MFTPVITTAITRLLKSSPNYLTISVLLIHIKQTGIAFFGGPSVGFLLNSVFKRDVVQVNDYQDYYAVDVFAVFGMEYFLPVSPGKAHSARRLVTGLASAALTAWKLTVMNVMLNAPRPAEIKIHQLIPVR